MSTATVTIRTFEGVDIPAPGDYSLDASHSHVGFSVRHLMVSKVKGRFGEFTGSVHIAENPLDSAVEVEIATASIDTGDDKRDAHLRSADFFDTDANPALSYRSTNVRSVGANHFVVDGDLTVAGVTRSVPLQVTFEGVAGDPWGGVRIGFEAVGELDREQFGLNWNQALETGGFLVGKQVKLEIQAEAVLQA